MSWRSLTRHHPTIGYTYIPDLQVRVDGQGGGYLVKTNEAGFRCAHPCAERKSSTRALLFGDSYTAGDGVSNSARYGEQLEKLLPGLEVLNFGLPGTGTDQHYLTWKEFGRHLEHDLVIVGVFVENILRCWSRFREYRDGKGQRQIYAKPYFQINAQGELVLHGTPVPAQPIKEEELDSDEFIYRGAPLPGAYRVFRRLGFPDVGESLSRFDLVPEYEDPFSPQWQLLRRILLDWHAECQKPVLLVPIPYFAYVEERADARHYQARFRELAAEAGCLLHDPLADLLAYPMEARRSFRFKTDPHFTAQGHEALARSLAPAVRSILFEG